MRQQSIFLCHILIIGIISANLSPPDRVISTISENTLRRSGNDENSDNADMKNKCSHVEQGAISTRENKRKAPSCQGLNIRSIENVTTSASFYISNIAQDEPEPSTFIKKLISTRTVKKKELQYPHVNRSESKENHESGNSPEETQFIHLQERGKEGTKGTPLKNRLLNISNTSMKTKTSYKRRDLRNDSALKLANMKRALSTEQSITLTSLSDNDRLSKDNSNDTANSKEADSNEMKQLRSIATELIDINQGEKEATTYESHNRENAEFRITPDKNSSKSVIEKYIRGVKNDSQGLPTRKQTKGFTNATLPYSQPSWDFTTETVNSNSSKTLHIRKSFVTDFQLTGNNSEIQDVSRDPISKDDVRYGKVKFSNEAKVTSNAIGSLKSHLDKKLSSDDSSDVEVSPTTVSSDVQTYVVDIYSTFLTPDSLYFANDSAVSLEKSANKVLQDIPWPVKKEAVVEGDVIIGGLMMVHEREDSITCGPIMPQGGVQALEAMLYTLDQVNFVIRPFLPNITLGAHILDDCDKDTYGLEMAVDFIKGLAAVVGQLDLLTIC